MRQEISWSYLQRKVVKFAIIPPNRNQKRLILCSSYAHPMLVNFLANFLPLLAA